MKSSQGEESISIWLWLIFPVLFLIFVIFAVLILSDIGGILYIQARKGYYFNLSDFLLNNENGIVELGTVLILFFGILYGLKIVNNLDVLPNYFITAWYCLLTLGCVYFAGEEISWGQHIFKWSTPEFIIDVNDQNETNFHNISSWFDQKPRLLFIFWVLISGVIVPVYLFLKNIFYKKSDWRYWFWPPILIFPVAFVAIFIKIFELVIEIAEYNHLDHYVRFSELQEFYLAYFLMLYLFLSHKKLISLNKL